MKDSERARAPPVRRCGWTSGDPLLVQYHDTEWGVPEHDDRRLFEFLILEGAQAGLSWLTVLKKRESYRNAFEEFDPAKVARYDSTRVRALLADDGLIRNRQKTTAAIQNAKMVMAVREEFRSFDAYIWQFVDGRPIRNRWKRLEEIPAKTTESEEMSRALKRRGFKFVGPTTCYAYMQAVGMVNDHLIHCFRRRGEGEGGHQGPRQPRSPYKKAGSP